MNISILGDSISTLEGWNPPGWLTYYNPYQIPVEMCWWYQVIKRMYGHLLVNSSFCGSAVASPSPYAELFPCASSDRRLELGENPDRILIYMGINDFLGGTALEGTGIDTFEGGYRHLLRRIHAKYPRVQVICIAPPGMEEIQNIMKKVTAKSGDILLILTQSYDTLDGWHPTRQGMLELADEVMRQWNRISASIREDEREP